MRLPASNGQLERRDGKDGSGQGGSNTAFIAVSVTVVVVVLAVVVILYLLRGLRQKYYNPKYLPTKYLKQKWRDWTPQTTYSHVGTATDSNRTSRNITTSYNPTNTTSGNGGSGVGVDRNTSIRSIITLPGYTAAPRATEQVLGREGERAGMDVVVEFPETADEEETRRDEQMESLYQIRLVRRQEIAERERRRQERRDARDRGDWERLEELRLESRARAEALNLDPTNSSQTNLTAQAMIAEHQSRGRERRISSVTYASIGRVRHDGTRLRANSQDSDHRPLLDAAAPMGGGGPSSLRTVFHNRERSVSSALSVSTNASDERGEPTPPSTNHERSGSDPISSPSLPRDTPADSDIGDSQIPPPLPPQYDQLEFQEAPPYENDVERRASRLRTLPSIEVSTATPSNSAPPTPASPVRHANSNPGDRTYVS